MNVYYELPAFTFFLEDVNVIGKKKNIFRFYFEHVHEQLFILILYENKHHNVEIQKSVFLCSKILTRLLACTCLFQQVNSLLETKILNRH